MLGKYLEDALTLAGMSQSELARRWGDKSSSFVSRVMSGKSTTNRETLILWCSILQTPYWLEERILNTAGFATNKQIAQYNTETAAAEAHKRVQQERGL